MGSWVADTDHGGIGTNTVLAIYRNGWVFGMAPELFPAGARLIGRLADGSPFTLDVLQTDGDDAVVSESSVNWHMQRVDPATLRMGPPGTPAGAPATFWVIRGPASS
jgi:hypothetical protein